MAWKSAQSMSERREGALTAAMQLATAELAAALLPGARGPVGGTAQRLIHMPPGPAVDVGVATAQTADKVLLRPPWWQARWPRALRWASADSQASALRPRLPPRRVRTRQLSRPCSRPRR